MAIGRDPRGKNKLFGLRCRNRVGEGFLPVGSFGGRLWAGRVEALTVEELAVKGLTVEELVVKELTVKEFTVRFNTTALFLP